MKTNKREVFFNENNKETICSSAVQYLPACQYAAGHGHGSICTGQRPRCMDGTADTGWYDGTKTEYEISTAGELAGLAVLVNSGTKFEGETVLLLSDLDLGGYEWVSTGTGNNSQKCFGGTFDGKNHCIYNVKYGIA